MKQELIDELEAGWARQRPDLDASAVATAVRLEFVARGLNNAAAESVAALGLEWWEYDVLSALRRSKPPHRLSASALARASMLSTSAMTNRIDRLEQRGLANRVAHESDRRKTMVQLADRGKALCDKATTMRFDAAKDAMNTLTSHQRQQLDKLLDRLIGSRGLA